MKLLPQAAALLAMLAPLSCSAKPSSDAQKASYAIGQDIGKSLSRFKDQIDLGALTDGLKDQLKGKPSKLSPEEMQAAIQAFQQSAMQAKAEGQKSSGEKNMKEGQEFLDKNKQKAGVKVTASGLQYEVVTEGKGRKPGRSDKVKVHYRGTLIDGTEFDSSYKRGEPIVFGVTQVIPGWTEALQLMGVGSKYKVAIPGNLAYGEGGAGDQIGPNATLLFDIELIDIVK